ncbi:hypothetical protein [Candidatus Chloroploca sp. Khr17]|uniref:hypothetical protein n=1 Tax=Candidatus Chloroploca sp. Khr17 TaxID=2496869 RepID=UPI00101DF062|nr:hypothetical protein [Candidatus Chloroploca sp. Khr17]
MPTAVPTEEALPTAISPPTEETTPTTLSLIPDVPAISTPQTIPTLATGGQPITEAFSPSDSGRGPDNPDIAVSLPYTGLGHTRPGYPGLYVLAASLIMIGVLLRWRR